jgi:hypothetical protein
MSRRSSAVSAAIAALLLSSGFAARAKTPEERQEQRGERRERRRQNQHPERVDARRDRAEQRRERRRQRVDALRARFGSALRQPAIRAELELHARRKAKLNALRAVAEREGKQALLPRIDALVKKEQARHQRRMAALTADAGSGR